MTEEIRVLIVDDSNITRDILKKLLEIDSAIRVVGMAENGKKAIELTRTLKPGVIIMDINMPVMNGFEATEQIMAYYPTPILILSSVIDKEGIYTTFNALAAGAIDVMEKPSLLPNASWNGIGEMLVRKLKFISRVKVVTHIKGKVKELYRRPAPVSPIKPNAHEIIGIGASTGGPSVVMHILKNIPQDYEQGVIVVQHMAEGFISGFAEWLRNACKVKVKLARDGEKIEKGQVLVAPDGFHTVISHKKTVGLIPGNQVNGVKPSIDILFDSIADAYGENAVGVLLTGMGADGAEGLKRIKDKGGVTIAQSENTCAVFGMPRVAIEKGAASKVLSVDEIIHTLNTLHNAK